MSSRILTVLLLACMPRPALAELESIYTVHELLSYFPSYPSVEHLLTGDFDGDGNADLLLWDAKISLAILPGYRGGGLGGHVRRPHPGVRGIQAVQDWDSDGKDDVLGVYRTAPNQNAPVIAAVVHGHATDYLGSTLSTTLPAQTRAGYWRDVDLDGRLDILYELTTGEWYVMLARSSGLESAVRLTGLPAEAYNPIFRDFNSDGLADVLFQVEKPYPVSGETYLALGLAPYRIGVAVLVTSTNGSINAVVDIDGDERLELIHRIHRSGFEVHSWQAAGHFAKVATRATEALHDEGELVRDLNQDGHVDWILPDYGDATIEVVLGNGTPDFGERFSIPTSTYARRVVAGPFGADGGTGLAVLVGAVNPTLLVYPRPADPPRRKEIYFPGWPSTFIAMDACDVDGDGVNELLTVTGHHARPDSIRVMGGRGEFELERLGVVELPSEVFRAQFADFTGDGRVDCLVAGLNPREYAVYPGIESAPYFGSVPIRSPLEEPLPIDFDEPLLVIAVDYDGDGDADVLQAHRRAGVLRYYRNDGTGRLTPVAYWLIQGGIRTVAPFDVQQTPGVETAVLDRASGRVRLLSLDSRDVVTELWSRPTIPGMTLLHPLDMDGDQFPDMVVAAQSSNKVQVLQGLEDGTLADPREFQLPGPVVAVQVGDLDGDGVDELAGVHRNGDLLRVGTFPGEHGKLAAAEYAIGAIGGAWRLLDLTGEGAAEFVGEWGNRLGVVVSWNDRRREEPPETEEPPAPSPFRIVGVSPQPGRGPFLFQVSGGVAGESYEATVFSVGGQLQQSLRGALNQDGPFQVEWNGLNSSAEACPAGVYFVRIRHVGMSATTRMILVR